MERYENLTDFKNRILHHEWIYKNIRHYRMYMERSVLDIIREDNTDFNLSELEFLELYCTVHQSYYGVEFLNNNQR
jgi:hypothetical protein